MGGPLDVSPIEGYNAQRREYLYNIIAASVPSMADTPELLYGDLELIYVRLLNEGLITHFQGKEYVDAALLGLNNALTALTTRVSNAETKITFLTDMTYLTVGQDFNTYLANGGRFFVTNAAAANANSPTAVAGVLEVQADPGSNYIWQRYTEYNTGYKMWLRARATNLTWSTWKSVTAV